MTNTYTPIGWVPFHATDRPSFGLPLFSDGRSDRLVQVPDAFGETILSFETIEVADGEESVFPQRGLPVLVGGEYNYLLIIDFAKSIWFLGPRAELLGWAIGQDHKLGLDVRLQLADLFPDEELWSRARAESMETMYRSEIFSPPFNKTIEAQAIFHVFADHSVNVTSRRALCEMRRAIMMRCSLSDPEFVPDDLWAEIKCHVQANKELLRVRLIERLGLTQYNSLPSEDEFLPFQKEDQLFFDSEMKRISAIPSVETQLSIVLRALYDFGPRAKSLVDRYSDTSPYNAAYAAVIKKHVNFTSYKRGARLSIIEVVSEISASLDQDDEVGLQKALLRYFSLDEFCSTRLGQAKSERSCKP